MPVFLLDFALAQEREAEPSRSFDLSGGEQQLLLQAINLIQLNPSIFIKDYDTFDPNDVDTLLDRAVNKIMDDTLSEITPDRRKRFFADGYNVLSGTFTWTAATLQTMAGYWLLGNVINNFVRFDFVSLRRGTYQIAYMGVRGSSHGIASFKLDGVVKTSIDTYVAGALQHNQNLLSPSFTVSDDGVYTLLVQSLSKNASSAGYFLGFTWIEFYRISD